MEFNKRYFVAAVILFLTEVFIAIFIQDDIIRPYGGDYLVVIFLYCFLKSFFKIPVKNAIFGVLFFAFFIEGLQYFRFVSVLGLQDNRIASVVLGNHFEWLDMLLYCLGALTILWFENVLPLFFRSKKTSA